MIGTAWRGVAAVGVLLASAMAPDVSRADAAKPNAADEAKAAAAAADAAGLPDELIFLAQAEADAVIATGKPGCNKGKMVLTYQPETGFLEDGAVFKTEEIGFAVGEAARAGQISCLIIQAAAYDRAMFLRLRNEYAAPNGVSLIWIPKTP